MTRMKYALARMLFIAVIAGVLLSQSLSAQPGQRTERFVQRLNDSLALTDVQLPKIKALVAEYQEQLQADRDNRQGDRETMMAVIRERSEKLNTQIDSILTPVQREKFKTMKFGQPNQMRQRMGGGDRPQEGRPREGMPGRDGM
jgi:Spy/CpxP family protein refolding chaperone